MGSNCRASRARVETAAAGTCGVPKAFMVQFVRPLSCSHAQSKLFPCDRVIGSEFLWLLAAVSWPGVAARKQRFRWIAFRCNFVLSLMFLPYSVVPCPTPRASLFQATMVGILILKLAYYQAGLVLLLMVLTYFAKSSLRGSYEPAALSLPLEIAKVLGELHRLHNDRSKERAVSHLVRCVSEASDQDPLALPPRPSSALVGPETPNYVTSPDTAPTRFSVSLCSGAGRRGARSAARPRPRRRRRHRRPHGLPAAQPQGGAVRAAGAGAGSPGKHRLRAFPRPSLAIVALSCSRPSSVELVFWAVEARHARLGLCRTDVDFSVALSPVEVRHTFARFEKRFRWRCHRWF